MRARLLAHLLVLTVLAPLPASAQDWHARRDSAPGPTRDGQRGAPQPSTDPVFQRGYQEGYREGERDARQRRSFDLRRHDAYNDGDRGYSRDRGDRTRYRDQFRRGFEAGYRSGYERVRGVDPGERRGDRGLSGNRSGFSEPAYARGYADGFAKGRDDWQDRDRYDPVRHREYRDGDRGYSGNYGSRDAYKQYYREGFREGYEDGYRGHDRAGRR